MYHMKIKKFKEYIKDGLITTHNIIIYSKILTNYLDNFNIKHTIKIVDKLNFYLEIYTNDINILKGINHQALTLGYFPSIYKVTLSNGSTNRLKNIPNMNNVSIIEINYEAKYEDGLYKNDIICPDKLYHLSYDDNNKSIMMKGLYPKSKSRLSIHPERIYLFEDLNNYKILLNNLKLSDGMNGNYNKKYSLYEIDCIDDILILHTDPNYRFGYFTYDNITPNKINRIKDNL